MFKFDKLFLETKYFERVFFQKNKNIKIKTPRL